MAPIKKRIVKDGESMNLLNSSSDDFKMNLSAFVSKKYGSDTYLYQCLLATDSFTVLLRPKYKSTRDFLENYDMKKSTRKNPHKNNNRIGVEFLHMIHDASTKKLVKNRMIETIESCVTTNHNNVDFILNMAANIRNKRSRLASAAKAGKQMNQDSSMIELIWTDLIKCVQDALIGYQCLKICIGNEDISDDHFYQLTNNATTENEHCESIMNYVGGRTNLLTKEEISTFLEIHDEEHPESADARQQ